jgi:antitoxin YefM
MTSLTASQARANLYRLIDETVQSHRPIAISGKRSNAVLVAQEDWDAIQETLHLVSVPGMRESLIKARKEPIEKCAATLKW